MSRRPWMRVPGWWRRSAWLGVLASLLLAAAGCARPPAQLPAVALPSPTPAAALSLPRDAGPHASLTEWWYFTGHLRSAADGHAYGFEFTIFQVQRQGAPTGYLAHFAVTDVDGQRFSHQAQVQQIPPETTPAFPLNVDGWTLASDGATDTIQAAMHAGPGADPSFGIQLRLTDEKPPVLHHGGYIDYGAAGGSYYYSRTRLAVTGTLRQADADPVQVSGEAWMDHQWGNFVVSAAGGWDWYSLQLDDRSELMLYVLRGPNGETTGVYGTQVQPDGSTLDLQPGSVQARAVGQWTSPHTGGVYPSGWQLTLADGEQLSLQPLVADQELYFPTAGATQPADAGQPPASAARQSGGPTPQTDAALQAAVQAGVGALAYWEGAVSVSGDRTGQGYVELTGYAGR